MKVKTGIEIKTARGIRKDGTKRDGKTRELVEVIEVPVYDSIPEMVAKLTEDVVLALANTQNITNIKNKRRAEAAGLPNESDLKNEFVLKISQTPALLAELQSIGTDKIRLQAFMDAGIAALKAEKGIPVAEDDDSEA